MEKQHTIKKSVSISGTGLHTGQSGTLTFHPADINHGIKFRRVDLFGKPIVEALVKNVVDTSRGTTIAQNGVKVYTVEHIMAALRASNIDNVLIDLNCEEPPILDGSSRIVFDALKEAGYEEQDAERKCLKVDYKSGVLNVQEAHMTDISEFEKEFAMCRTFVFFQELEMLLAHNLIKGGDLSNAIVFIEKQVSEEDLKRVANLFHKESIAVHEGGILNNVTLYFENEPARHKLLDLIGDLTLLGMPIIGKVTAYKPGHFSNTEFVKLIVKKMGVAM